MKIKAFIQTIFSIKNVDIHKQIMICGIKIKIKSKKLIERKLQTLNNKKYVCTEFSYDKNRKIGLDIRKQYIYSSDITALQSYHILNKVKEIDLKQKILRGKKVKVAFFLDSISKFSTNSIYNNMKNSNLFEPFIILGCTDENYFNNEVVWNKYLAEYETLKLSGYEVCSIYDENRNPIPINNFKFDIIFISVPYLEIYETAQFSNTYLNTNYLVCYVNYGWIVSNSYIYYYNNRRINTTWKNFVLSKTDYDEYIKYSKDLGLNAVLTGYPKLDVYAKQIEECKIPDKINNGNPIVIYAPHWSVRHNWEPSDLSTFDIYGKYFLNLVKKYQNINFVFKPHPALAKNLMQNKIMTFEEFDDYIKEWEAQPNGYYEMGGEYIDLFRKSSLLIQDSESFIAEYLPSGNPCMYLVKPSRNQETYMDGFSLSARKILETYYLCHNQEEIEKYFNMIMFEKHDPMKNEREKIKDEIFINIGCAGQKIVDYLTELLTD